MRSANLALLIGILSTLNALWPFPAAIPAVAAEVAMTSESHRTPPDLSALVKASRWLELLAAATDASQRYPDDASLLAYKLTALRMLGNTDAALVQADQALVRFPGDPGLLLERAWIQTFKGSWARALMDAQAAAADKP